MADRVLSEVRRLQREARKRNGRELGPPRCWGNNQYCGKPCPDADPEEPSTWLCPDCQAGRSALILNR
jgi:hypothetical protein